MTEPIIGNEYTFSHLRGVHGHNEGRPRIPVERLGILRRLSRTMVEYDFSENGKTRREYVSRDACRIKELQNGGD